MRREIIKIRPGLLANFSGGAGYMPFVSYFATLVSAVAALIGHFVLYCSSKSFFQKSASGSPVDLLALQQAMRKHTIVCLALALVGGAILTFVGSRMVYGDFFRYLPATLLLAAGPFVAWVLSTFLLGLLLIRQGRRWFWPLVSLGIYLLATAFFIVAGFMLC